MLTILLLLIVYALCKLSLRYFRHWYSVEVYKISGSIDDMQWTTMNYGYPCDDGKGSMEACALHLYEQVASYLSRNCANCLEVSSGRGGGLRRLGIKYPTTIFEGIDYSEGNVRQSRKLCKDVANISFLQGDALKLPFEAERFETVLNVEASHAYGDYMRFFVEVHRVLKPDGVFMYTDFASPKEFLDIYHNFTKFFTILQATDITDHIVKSLTHTHDEKINFLNRTVKGIHRVLIKQLYGCRGSIIYKQFMNKDRVYFVFVAQKK